MGFYQRVFFPEQPDLLPAASPHGIRAVGVLLLREWRTLIKLNLILTAMSLPIVTIGPALAAVTDLLLRIVRDQPILLSLDFCQALRTHAKRGLICTASMAVCGVLLVCALFVYAQAGLAGQYVCLIPFMLSCILSVLYLAAIPYILPLCTLTALPLRSIWKNAVLLGICHPLNTLAALLLALSVDIPFLLIWPVSLPFFAFFVVVFQLLILNWMAWRVIRGHLPEDFVQSQEVAL